MRWFTPGAPDASSIVEIMPHNANPALHVQRVQGGDQMITADIVEVQVDTFRRRGGQPPTRSAR